MHDIMQLYQLVLTWRRSNEDERLRHNIGSPSSFESVPLNEFNCSCSCSRVLHRDNLENVGDQRCYVFSSVSHNTSQHFCKSPHKFKLKSHCHDNCLENDIAVTLCVVRQVLNPRIFPCIKSILDLCAVNKCPVVPSLASFPLRYNLTANSIANYVYSQLSLY